MDILQTYEKYCQYTQFIKNYSPRTISGGKIVINVFVRESGLKNLEEVNEAKAMDYFLTSRIEKNWMPNTFISNHKCLSVFWNWCVKQKFVSSNPFLEVEKPRLEKKLPRKLSKEEATLLLDTARNMPARYKFEQIRNYSVIALMLFTGLRRCEVLNLMLNDVDIEGGTIFVRQGKGKKDRILPINFTLRDILERYLKARNQRKSNCLNFFISIKHHIAYSESGLKKFIHRLRAKTKLSFSAHSLRHTFATLMLESGCDIYTLSKMMGHADISTTTIYLSASAKHLQKSVQNHPLSF